MNIIAEDIWASENVNNAINKPNNVNVGKIVRDFWSFVNKHRISPGTSKIMTHTLLGPPRGTYSFIGGDHEIFMKKYCELMINKIPVDLHFVERPNECSFLFLDFDFNHRSKKRFYTLDHIKLIIKCVNNLISQTFHCTDKQLTAFITEKEAPTFKPNEKLYKDGPHIYYPHLPMTIAQRYYVIDTLKDLFEREDMFNDIPYVNEMNDIFDTSIVDSNGILMLGSIKVGGKPYELTHVFDRELVEIDLDKYDIEEQIYLLSNRRYDDESHIIPINEESEELFAQALAHHAPKNKKKLTPTKTPAMLNKKSERGKSNRSTDFDETFTNDNSESFDNSESDDNLESFDNSDEIDTDDCSRSMSDGSNNLRVKRKLTAIEKHDIELVKKLIDCMSVQRSKNYDTWRNMGCAMYAVSDTLLDEYKRFSRKCLAKYNENKVPCEQIWNYASKNCDDRDRSINNIRHWAWLDNKERFYQTIVSLMPKLLGNAMSSKHVDIADIVYELYKGRFVCVNIKDKKWFEFQDHRWVMIQSGYTLATLISVEVRKIMKEYVISLLKKGMDDYDNDNGSTKKHQQMLMTIDRLADVPFRDNILVACSSKFHDEEFEKKLNANFYLVGFNNGVYDLKEGRFRNGVPADYLTMTVGYDYKEYNENDPVFTKIHRYFSQVLTEFDIREYVLTFIASILRGVPDSKLHIWTGGGGNGKSATVELIKQILGQYFGTMPVTVLTRKKMSSSGANPEMADKMGKRLVLIQEPEYNDTLYVGQMKEISGKDTVMARALYGNPFEFVPQFKLILTCNVLPRIPSNDRGTWRRLRVTPYETEFVEKNPQGPKQFLIDEELGEEFPTWAQPFMWLILNKYYPIYKKGCDKKPYQISEPPKVTQYTNEYKKGSDIYMEFLDENVEMTGNKEDYEHMTVIFDSFKNWYTTSYSEKAPPKKEFIDYLKKNKYIIDKQKIYGIKYDVGLH